MSEVEEKENPQRRTSKFFAKILVGRGRIYYELLRGYASSAPEDIREYIRKKCKSDNLLLFFQRRKNIFQVEEDGIVDLKGRARKKMQAIVWSTDDENEGKNDIQKRVKGKKKTKTAKKKTAESEPSVLKTTSLPTCAISSRNINPLTSKVQVQNSSSSSSSDEETYEKIALEYFTDSIKYSSNLVNLNEIRFEELPNLIKRYLKKYPTKRVQSFFLEHCTSFLVDDDGYVDVRDSTNLNDVLGEDKSMDDSSSHRVSVSSDVSFPANEGDQGLLATKRLMSSNLQHPKKRKKKHNSVADKTGQLCDEEIRILEFFVNILEQKSNSTTSSIPIDRLRGHLSQADIQVVNYFKSRYKGEQFKQLFVKHPKVFFVNKRYISLNKNYASHIAYLKYQQEIRKNAPIQNELWDSNEIAENWNEPAESLEDVNLIELERDFLIGLQYNDLPDKIKNNIVVFLWTFELFCLEQYEIKSVSDFNCEHAAVYYFFSQLKCSPLKKMSFVELAEKLNHASSDISIFFTRRYAGNNFPKFFHKHSLFSVKNNFVELCDPNHKLLQIHSLLDFENSFTDIFCCHDFFASMYLHYIVLKKFCLILKESSTLRGLCQLFKDFEDEEKALLTNIDGETLAKKVENYLLNFEFLFSLSEDGVTVKNEHVVACIQEYLAMVRVLQYLEQHCIESQTLDHVIKEFDEFPLIINPFQDHDNFEQRLLLFIDKHKGKQNSAAKTGVPQNFKEAISKLPAQCLQKSRSLPYSQLPRVLLEIDESLIDFFWSHRPVLLMQQLMASEKFTFRGGRICPLIHHSTETLQLMPDLEISENGTLELKEALEAICKETQISNSNIENLEIKQHENHKESNKLCSEDSDSQCTNSNCSSETEFESESLDESDEDLVAGVRAQIKKERVETFQRGNTPNLLTAENLKNTQSKPQGSTSTLYNIHVDSDESVSGCSADLPKAVLDYINGTDDTVKEFKAQLNSPPAKGNQTLKTEITSNTMNDFNWRKLAIPTMQTTIYDRDDENSQYEYLFVDFPTFFSRFVCRNLDTLKMISPKIIEKQTQYLEFKRQYLEEHRKNVNNFEDFGQAVTCQQEVSLISENGLEKTHAPKVDEQTEVIAEQGFNQNYQGEHGNSSTHLDDLKTGSAIPQQSDSDFDSDDEDAEPFIVCDDKPKVPSPTFNSIEANKPCTEVNIDMSDPVKEESDVFDNVKDTIDQEENIKLRLPCENEMSNFNGETNIKLQHETKLGVDEKTDVTLDRETDITLDRETDISGDIENDLGLDRKTELSIEGKSEISGNEEAKTVIDVPTDTRLVEETYIAVDGKTSDVETGINLSEKNISPPKEEIIVNEIGPNFDVESQRERDSGSEIEDSETLIFAKEHQILNSPVGVGYNQLKAFLKEQTIEDSNESEDNNDTVESMEVQSNAVTSVSSSTDEALNPTKTVNENKIEMLETILYAEDKVSIHNVKSYTRVHIEESKSKLDDKNKILEENMPEVEMLGNLNEVHFNPDTKSQHGNNCPLILTMNERFTTQISYDKNNIYEEENVTEKKLCSLNELNVNTYAESQHVSNNGLVTNPLVLVMDKRFTTLISCDTTVFQTVEKNGRKNSAVHGGSDEDIINIDFVPSTDENSHQCTTNNLSAAPSRNIINDAAIAPNVIESHSSENMGKTAESTTNTEDKQECSSDQSVFIDDINNSPHSTEEHFESLLHKNADQSNGSIVVGNQNETGTLIDVETPNFRFDLTVPDTAASENPKTEVTENNDKSTESILNSSDSLTCPSVSDSNIFFSGDPSDSSDLELYASPVGEFPVTPTVSPTQGILDTSVNCSETIQKCIDEARNSGSLVCCEEATNLISEASVIEKMNEEQLKQYPMNPVDLAVTVESSVLVEHNGSLPSQKMSLFDRTSNNETFKVSDLPTAYVINPSSDSRQAEFVQDFVPINIENVQNEVIGAQSGALWQHTFRGNVTLLTEHMCMVNTEYNQTTQMVYCARDAFQCALHEICDDCYFSLSVRDELSCCVLNPLPNCHFWVATSFTQVQKVPIESIIIQNTAVSMQGHIHELSTSSMQSDSPELKTTSVQSDSPELKTTSVQSYSPELNASSTQTDYLNSNASTDSSPKVNLEKETVCQNGNIVHVSSKASKFLNSSSQTYSSGPVGYRCVLDINYL